MQSNAGSCSHRADAGKAGLHQTRHAKLSRESWFVLCLTEIPEFASRSLRKCRAIAARGATRSLFACVSRGLPGHLRCGISTSPKTQVKCGDFKHVVACLLAVGCRLSQKEIKNLLQLP